MLRLTTAKMNFLCLLVALALVALPAFAQISPGDQILHLLKKNGYSIELQERTWLGRGRVIASKDGMRRELVFNPGTGEIMRDYVILIADADKRSNDSSAASANLVPSAVSTDAGSVAAPVATPVEPVINLDWSPSLIGAGQ